MTDPRRPNPLGLPPEPDPTLPSGDPVKLPGDDDVGSAIDEPMLWPADDPEQPDPERLGSLDLPGETSEAPTRRRAGPDPRIR